MGRVALIAGTHRRRILRFPDLVHIRPTPHRLRETLFNWLGQDLLGYRCLDLFAGSGALGFEAASRGAMCVDMVERHLSTYQSLFNNRKLLLFHNVSLFCTSAEQFTQRATDCYDVIFCDPPFQCVLSPLIGAFLSTHLKEDGYLYWEQSVHKAFFFRDSPFWRVLKHTPVGESAGFLLQKRTIGDQDEYDSGLRTKSSDWA